MKYKLPVIILLFIGSSIFSYAKIKPDEDVIFYDTYMHYKSAEDSDTAILDVHGCVFEPEYDSPVRNAFINDLIKIIELKNMEPESTLFKNRMRWFLVDNELGKDISIKIGNRDYFAGKSAANGHFSGSFDINIKELKETNAIDSNGILKYLAKSDGREFHGQCMLIGRTGVSVI